MSEFKRGAVVHLAGYPQAGMTVRRVYEVDGQVIRIVCQWFDREAELHEQSFKPSSLKSRRVQANENSDSEGA